MRPRDVHRDPFARASRGSRTEVRGTAWGTRECMSAATGQRASSVPAWNVNCEGRCSRQTREGSKILRFCARNVSNSDWVCRDCALVCLGSGRFWCISGLTVVSGGFGLEPAVTQPIERDAIYRRRRFPRDVIETCVRWYLTYRLSYRDLVALMAERTRIREAVKPQGEAGRFVLARRRNLHSHPAQDGLLVSCR